jgi:hypothetical protein
VLNPPAHVVISVQEVDDSEPIENSEFPTNSLYPARVGGMTGGPKTSE